ncbi:MAG: hypothetical protein KDD89_09495, partial [Anaerolineales bacterium]|nr:hypothetical protein [Anaerolineales bacterium]
EEQPVKPANILNIVATNQGKRPLTPSKPKAKPLSVGDVLKLVDEGCVIVDARSSAVFGAGHIAGSFNVQLTSSEFEQRVGWVTPDDSRFILVTDKDAQAQEAIFKMAFIALDSQVEGYLEGGIEAWMKAGKPLQTVKQMDVFTLHHKLHTNGLQVLDVRDQEEWDEGHIEVAHLMPYTSLVPQLDIPARIDELPFAPEQSIAITCATGQRSSTAASLLLRHGYKNLYNVTGGMTAWEDANLPMLDGDGNACGIS